MKKLIYKPKAKAIRVHRESHLAKYILLEGAVRSAKSFTADDLAIREIQQLPDCDILVSGYSISSVARNVISAWKRIIDPENNGLFTVVKEGKDEFLKINWRGFRGKKFYIRGAGKENDWMQIQGATFGYWYADELTRHKENFVDMAQTRLSLSFSKAIWTTNPEHPQHFVKTKFIDAKEKQLPIREGGRALLKVFTFYLTDNPSLSPEVIDELRNSYTGFFYKRYILSQWVAAEGAVYDFFDEDLHTLPYIKLPQPQQKIISIDYGTSNPTSMGMYGINLHTKPKIWRERSYYYDSKEEGRQKSDTELCKDLFDFIEGETTISMIIVDPSAASFKVELKNQMRKKGMYIRIHDADNAVLDGIRTQARMLKHGEYSISDHPTNKQCVLDYSSYLWDEKAALRGEDKPLKENDHTKDEERYALYTIFGDRTPIDYDRFLEL